MESILIATDVTAAIDAFVTWALTVVPAFVGLVAGLASLRFGLRIVRRTIAGG